MVGEALNADPAKKATADANPSLFKGLLDVGAAYSFEICDKDGSKTISFAEFKASMPAILSKTRVQYKKDLATSKKK